MTAVSYPFVDNFKLTYIGPTGDSWASSNTKLYRKLSGGDWQVSSFIPIPIKSIWQSTSGQVVYLAVSGGYSYSGLWRSTDRGENFTQDSAIYHIQFSTSSLLSTVSYLYVTGNYTSTTGGFMFRIPLSTITVPVPDWGHGEVSLNGAGFTIYPMGLTLHSGQLQILSGQTYSGIFSLDETGLGWTNITYHSDLVALDSDGTTIVASFVPSNVSVAQVAAGPGYSFIATLGNYSLGKPLEQISHLNGAFLAVGADGLGSGGIWRSSDGGAHWSRVRSDSTSYVVGGGTTALAGTSGQILKSTDTGLTWSCDSCSAPVVIPPPPPPPPVVITPPVSASSSAVLSSTTSLKHPVILIHGIGGRPDDWKNNGVESLLVNLGYTSNLFKTFNFSDTLPYNYQGEITEIGSKLPSVIDQLSSISPDGKVDIVGFSMGGVVGRQGLVANPSAASKVRNFISIGVPNLGSYLVTFFAGDTSKLSKTSGLFTLARNFLLSRVVEIFRGGNQPLDANSAAVQELRIGSSFLNALNAQPLPRSIQTYSLFGDENIVLRQKLFFLDLHKEFGLGDLVVDRSSAGTIPGTIPDQFAYAESPQVDVHLLRSTFAAEYNFVGNPQGMKYFHNNLLSQPEIKNKILEILNR